MAFEISLKHPLSPPHILHAQRDESPRKDAAHWVGEKQNQAQGKPDNPKNTPPQKQDSRGYRPLTDITIGEVNDVLQYFEAQLIAAPLEGWIRKNYFCLVHLKTMNRTRPSAIFGRVKSCYPNEGHADNVQEAELYFPHKDGKPDVLQIHADNINRAMPTPVQSYCLRVQLCVTDNELEEFKGSDTLFTSRGFIPKWDLNLVDLLDMTEENHQSYPWLYVIGSRWFADIPESMYNEMKWKLDKMLSWGKHIVNYHPDWLPKDINPLNKVLGYKYKLTRNLLAEPENPDQTARIVGILFDEIFLKQETD